MKKLTYPRTCRTGLLPGQRKRKSLPMKVTLRSSPTIEGISCLQCPVPRCFLTKHWQDKSGREARQPCQADTTSREDLLPTTSPNGYTRILIYSTPVMGCVLKSQASPSILTVRRNRRNLSPRLYNKHQIQP
ncbi:protein Flattop isoform X3 [Mus musculus]|uniref:protein Flattop isoform X3 n=1 Tax=Mus musculus TaxID=10090 RepID=UPI0005ABAA50|nr:protein Flattop isoform X3 [Mus musculus]XP_011237182.1 protein Flattop isoform X3 [Mus musculus]|eukprot:XP_011237181.1 PREDICTED: protein Flattop isoform X4 [Mus musculus]